MGYFVYVSHKRPVDAFVAAEKLMNHGHFPFVPQLNKLVAGRKDPEWENYFKMWLFRCDCILLTERFREHERDWAVSNKIPVVTSVVGVNDIRLPPFAELGREFGMEVASLLPKSEEWRKRSREDLSKEFQDAAGLGRDPVEFSVLALKAWDMKKRSAI
jgi:hypothetical protein